MPKVLVVTNMWPNPRDPGYGSFVEEQVRSLEALGVECDVLFVNGRESVWNYVRGIRQVRARLRGSRYDLVHAHFGLSAWVARFQARAPLVVTFHGDDVMGRPDRRGGITAIGRVFQVSSYVVARLASAVIVQSGQMKAKLGLESAHVIPCGVDLAMFQPIDRAEARRALGLDPHRKYVLFPYHPGEARKRFDLIEAAVARARSHVPGLEILQVREQPHSAVPAYMNAADVFVLASTIEGSPMAIKEAMAVNLPVVTVDVGDSADLIAGCDGNHLVERDADAIAAKIVEVCRRGQRTMGREAIAPLSLANIARRILDVYAALLEKQTHA